MSSHLWRTQYGYVELYEGMWDIWRSTELIVTNTRTSMELRERISIVQMADEVDCEHAMYVKISCKDKVLESPLDQIKPLYVNEDTVETIGDWHYWEKLWYTF